MDIKNNSLIINNASIPFLITCINFAERPGNYRSNGYLGVEVFSELPKEFRTMKFQPEFSIPVEKGDKVIVVREKLESMAIGNKVIKIASVYEVSEYDSVSWLFTRESENVIKEWNETKILSE